MFVKNFDSFDFYMAKTVFEKMAKGNYLDVIQESWYPISDSDPNSPTKRNKYEQIRQNNLSFLDKITTQKDKELFVNYYKTLTAFPSLDKMQYTVRGEALKSAIAASKECSRTSGNPTAYKIIRIGFNPVCSAGHNAVLPGSDIDGLHIILNGTGDLDKDIIAVERFKGPL